MDGGRDDSRLEKLRIPPQSVEAEQSVLGGLMIAPHAWPLVSELLTEADFYRRDHQLIWRAIAWMAEKGRPFDAVTIGEFLERRGFAEQVAGGAYLIELASTTPSAANIVAYAQIVGERSSQRRMIELGTQMVSQCFEPGEKEFAEILSDAQAQMVELQPAQRGGLRRASESLPGWYERYCARFGTQSQLTGLPTPWSGLNAVTHGLQPATFYLVAARPSMGKSILALNLASMLSQRGKTVALFSLEMSADDCHSRIASSLCGIPHDAILAPSDDFDYSEQVSAAYRKMRDAPLFIDDTPALTVRQFEARARRMHQRNPMDALIIDHIHDFKIDPKLARFEYGVIAQCAKSLGKEWDIPVIALAQLNRNVTGRTDKRPTLGDLRESGELEQKADVIVFLHREDYYDSPEETTHLQGVVEAHIAKGRNIKSGARINLRNSFDQMRLDEWEGPLPKPKPKKSKAMGYGDSHEESGRDRAAGPDR